AVSDSREGGADGLFRVTRDGDTTDAITHETRWTSPSLFRVARDGDPTGELWFLVTPSGAADPTSDYTLAGNTPNPGYNYVLLPAGAATVDIPITAIDDAQDEGDEAVEMTLTAYAGYDI